jgi:transposase
MTRQTYATDVTESEWSYLEPHLPAPKSGGRPRRHAVREILNAIFYALRSGCAWRLLPHDLPPWKTVYHYFRLWRVQGLWPALHNALHTAVRRQAGRDPSPSAAQIPPDLVVKSQAVDIAEVFETTAGDETSSTGRVVTGNHEGSCSKLDFVHVNVRNRQPVPSARAPLLGFLQGLGRVRMLNN